MSVSRLSVLETAIYVSSNPCEGEKAQAAIRFDRCHLENAEPLKGGKRSPFAKTLNCDSCSTSTLFVKKCKTCVNHNLHKTYEKFKCVSFVKYQTTICVDFDINQLSYKKK